jgi:UDP-GlcNAc:undecaprenyl-phosphate GlcNAc-1-phosphate transferase
MLSILIGGFLVVLVGIFDDVKPVPAKIKFIVQVLAAAVVVFYGRIFFGRITFLGLDFTFPVPLNYLFTILFMVGTMNAINLIDGLDGLAGGISEIYFVTITVIAILLNRLAGLDIILTLIMVGATLGFLVHNFPPAKIFMGDSGSLFLGFMISVIALVSYKVATLTSLIIPIVILAIPIFDTALAIFRRLLKKENIGAPDKEHFHHQLLKLKLSIKKSILIIYLISIVFSSVAVCYVIGYTKIAIIIYVFLMILLLFVILKTDILYCHKHKEKSNKK